jgi:hypothetical protein
MHRLALILWLAFAPAVATAWAQERLVVTPSTVRLAVAVSDSPDSLWTWYHPTTPDGRMEYGWFFVVPGTPEFSVGWMLFKKPGDRPASGSLKDLLAVGQRSVFGGGQRAQMLRRVRPSVVIQRDSLVLALVDSTAIADIFRSKPGTVSLQIIRPDAPSSTRTLRVIYSSMPDDEL